MKSDRFRQDKMKILLLNAGCICFAWMSLRFMCNSCRDFRLDFAYSGWHTKSCLLLTTYYLLLKTYGLRLTTYNLQLTTYDLQLTTYDLRLTTYDSRLTTHYSLLTTYY